MATQVYFSVQVTAAQRSLMPFPAPVAFDRIVAASAYGWNPTSNALTVTNMGAYFVSLTIEVLYTTYTGIVVTVNQVPKAMLSIVDVNKTNNWLIKNGIMSCRTACMLQLNTGDVIASSLQISWSSTDIYGSQDGISNMQAFFYSPQPAIGAPVAWSVASAITLVTYQPPSGIVGYDLVQVNTGHAWNPSVNASIIPVSGSYLIDVTSCLGTYHTCSYGNTGNHGN
jgi:hypothetical protein